MTAKEIKQKLLDHFEANFCQCDECKLTVTYLDQLCNQLCKEQRELCVKSMQFTINREEIIQSIRNAPPPKI